MRDYEENVTAGQTDRQTPDISVIPMCRYAPQATKKSRSYNDNLWLWNTDASSSNQDKEVESYHLCVEY